MSRPPRTRPAGAHSTALPPGHPRGSPPRPSASPPRGRALGEAGVRALAGAGSSGATHTKAGTRGARRVPGCGLRSGHHQGLSSRCPALVAGNAPPEQPRSAPGAGPPPDLLHGMQVGPPLRRPLPFDSGGSMVPEALPAFPAGVGAQAVNSACGPEALACRGGVPGVPESRRRLPGPPPGTADSADPAAQGPEVEKLVAAPPQASPALTAGGSSAAESPSPLQGQSRGPGRSTAQARRGLRCVGVRRGPPGSPSPPSQRSRRPQRPWARPGPRRAAGPGSSSRGRRAGCGRRGCRART